MKYFVDLLKIDIKKMSIKEHVYYWVLPLAIQSILLIFYFSGNPFLVEIVCPKENWEWGVLENLQLVIILIILSISIFAILNKKESLLKWGFFFISIFTLFVFLEEIDYGEHFAQLMGGTEEAYLKQYIPTKNIHNQGNNAKIIKRSVYLIMSLIFVAAPFLKSKFSNAYLLYLIPRPRIIIVAIITIASDLVPRLIVGFNIFKDGGLGVNINEFSEIMVYYIFLLYLIQLIFGTTLDLGARNLK